MKQPIPSIVRSSLAMAVIALTPILFSGAALAEDMYGAIATDEESHWGYSYNYPTRSQAEAQALSACGTGNCEILTWACTDR